MKMLNELEIDSYLVTEEDIKKANKELKTFNPSCVDLSHKGIYSVMLDGKKITLSVTGKGFAIVLGKDVIGWSPIVSNLDCHKLQELDKCLRDNYRTEIELQLEEKFKQQQMRSSYN